MHNDKLAIELIKLGTLINHKVYNSVMHFFTSRNDITFKSLYFDSLIGALIIQTNCIVLCVELDGYIHS